MNKKIKLLFSTISMSTATSAVIAPVAINSTNDIEQANNIASMIDTRSNIENNSIFKFSDSYVDWEFSAWMDVTTRMIQFNINKFQEDKIRKDHDVAHNRIILSSKEKNNNNAEWVTLSDDTYCKNRGTTDKYHKYDMGILFYDPGKYQYKAEFQLIGKDGKIKASFQELQNWTDPNQKPSIPLEPILPPSSRPLEPLLPPSSKPLEPILPPTTNPEEPSIPDIDNEFQDKNQHYSSSQNPRIVLLAVVPSFILLLVIFITFIIIFNKRNKTIERK